MTNFARVEAKPLACRGTVGEADLDGRVIRAKKLEEIAVKVVPVKK